MRLAAVLCAALWSGPAAFGQSADISDICFAPDGNFVCAEAPAGDPDTGLLPGHHTWFSEPTRRYPHGVLGDDVEWGTLNYAFEGEQPIRGEVRLDPARVFEDLRPRLADLDADGLPEIVVVESHRDLGGQLAIYAMDGGALRKRAATPHIGRANRWLAPAAIADFDGDGKSDVAYVETPHLGKVLRIWGYESGRLDQIAALRGVTNHRIGEDFISSVSRPCGGVAEVLLASADWTRTIGVRIADGRLLWRDLGPWRGLAALGEVAC